jgi:hypothetical protein
MKKAFFRLETGFFSISIRDAGASRWSLWQPTNF